MINLKINNKSTCEIEEEPQEVTKKKNDMFICVIPRNTKKLIYITQNNYIFANKIQPPWCQH